QPVLVKTVDLSKSAAGSRLLLSRSLPAAVIYPMGLLLTVIASGVFVGKSRRTMEALLLLPIARRDLLAGKGLAGFAVALFLFPATFAPLLAMVAVPALRPVPDLKIPGNAYAAIAVVLVLLALV